MVLITPYRPVVAPIPQETPHVVPATIGSVQVTPISTTIDAPPATRQTVLEGSFGNSPFYDNDLPWDFVNTPRNGGAWNSATMSEAFTTMNGHDAVAITWAAGALPSHRWGGRLDLPGAYDLAWFTYDVMFSDPFSPGTTNFGGKQPGLGSLTAPSGCVDPVPCNGGWSARRMWRGNKNSYSGSELLPGENYLYFPGKNSNCGDRFAFDQGFPIGEPVTVEEEVQIPSAFNASDGYVKTWINGTLVENTQGVPMYCGSEANRSQALIQKLIWLTIWGGATAAWGPAHDSTITFGHFTVEIPA